MEVMKDANLLARIERKPDVMLGKPVIKGTRITVELILELLAGGETSDSIVREYPRLTPEDIRAALAYASKALGTDETHWVKAAV